MKSLLFLLFFVNIANGQSIIPIDTVGKIGDTLSLDFTTKVEGRYKVQWTDIKTGAVISSIVIRFDSVVGKPKTVTDLRVVIASSTNTSMTLRFTEVDNGIGLPADYDIRYIASPLNHWWWGSGTSVKRGTCTSPLKGIKVGASRTCTVTGLTPGTNYEFQLVAFRGNMNVGSVTFGELSGVGSI